MLPDLHIGFSRGKSGGLLFSSLSEFAYLCINAYLWKWHLSIKQHNFTDAKTMWTTAVQIQKWKSESDKIQTIAIILTSWKQPQKY